MMSSELSLYLHLPFCKKKCRYCDFYSLCAAEKSIDGYLRALDKEFRLVQKAARIPQDFTFSTIFIGGGTPSLLSGKQLKQLCDLVHTWGFLASDCEWTIECNPESLTHEKIALLFDLGVNRLSIGLQSLDARELGFLGRIHTARQSLDLLADPWLEKFSSINVDVMYGLPGQTIESLMKTLTLVFSSPFVTHISAYELTIAAHTAFGRHKRLLPRASDDDLSAMTTLLWESLEQNGFRQYEISNFSKPGHECRHNNGYWDRKPYLGLGASAHSFISPHRWANSKNAALYCSSIDHGEFSHDLHEQISREQCAAEMLFLGLRRVIGVNEVDFKENCSINFVDFVGREKLEMLTKEGLLVYEKPFWKPTKKGLLMADAMALHLG